MGILQQQSILKGLQIKTNKEKELVHELFSCTATAHPNQIAIYYENDGEKYALSYEELENITRQLAKALQKYERYGTTKSCQSLIAVCMKPSNRLPIVLLSILKAAMAYLPLDAEFPMSRIEHILNEAQPLMVIVEEGADLSMYKGTLIVTYEQLVKEAKKIQEDTLKAKDIANQLAIVLYTSGSTGIPKGVLISHTALLNRLRWQWREFPYADDEERCAFKTSLTFVDSVSEIWGPLLQARTLVVIPKCITRDPERFVAVLEKHKIQRLVLVPSLLRSLLMYLNLLDNNENVLERLKLWICSGEILPITLADRFFAAFNNEDKVLANFYGSTEVMGDVTYQLLSKREQAQEMAKVPIGKPVDNCIIYLVNKEMQLIPQGEVGELVVAGKNLALGYMREKENHKFFNNPFSMESDYSRIFRTGDYARIVKDSLIYEGRVDSQIKVRGHRVDLTEVEKLISKIPNVDKVVVLCYKPGELSQTLIAFVTPTINTLLSSMEIEDFLQTLPPYMLPKIIIVDHIPLLTNGKIDRQALLKQYESSCPNKDNDIEANCNYADVSTQDLAKARVLFPTVVSIIGSNVRMPVTLHANFYELGGNSLNSIYTVTKLRDQGYQIGITDFITAKDFVEVLDRMKPIESFEEEPPKENMDETPYIFESLNNSHKKDTIEIITESFYTKADLEQWLMPDIKRSDYQELMEIIWNSMVEEDLSFVIKSAQTGKMLGVTLNFDLWDEPELTLNSKLMIVFDFLEYLEKPIREHKLPKDKGQIIHNAMMATSGDLSPAENVLVMRQMEEHCLRLGKQKSYAGIFTTNTNPLTQQLGTDVYGYEIMLAYQVNKYKAPDGSKPFGKAPDSQLAICSLKMIR